MKLYISADIEGVAGIAHWDETNEKKADYAPFVKQMTREVQAVCKGAFEAGVSEIWVKDAHGSARNMNPVDFPQACRFIRGWSGHPFMMMQEIDESFDAAIMVGYHSGSGSSGNALCHTLSGKVVEVRINGAYATEFTVNAYTAAYMGVPTVLVTGDWALAKHVEQANAQIQTVRVNKGVGDSSITVHPDTIVGQIEDATKRALKGDLKACMLELPETFEVELEYAKPLHAYKYSFYPGCELITDRIVRYISSDYMDVLRLFMFVL